MAGKYISDAWKSHLVTAAPPTDRFYIDFRQQQYAPLPGHNIGYQRIYPGENLPGTFNAAMFKYQPNIVTDPEDQTTANWGHWLIAVTLTDLYYEGKRFTKIEDMSATEQGQCYQNLGTPASAMQSFQAVYRKGSTTKSALRYQEHSPPYTTRGSLTIYWSTKNVIPTHGILVHADWIDDETVFIAGVATGCNTSSDHRINIIPATLNNAETGYCYVTAVRVEDSPYPAPYDITGSAVPDYCLQMPNKFTIRLVVKPWFIYDTTTYYKFFSWYIDDSHRWWIQYAPNLDKFTVTWRDGGAIAHLYSQQFDDGTSYDDINQWLIIDVAFDPSAGISGSKLWINRVLRSSVWNTAPDAKISNFALAWVAHQGGALQADSMFSHIILIPDYAATDTDVQNDYRDIKHEQIYWDFNGQAVGRTRCNISESVLSKRLAKTSSLKANRLSFSLASPNGEFADDQYGTFDPPNKSYNGTLAEKYLQQRCPVTAETWYSGDYEPYFFGRVDGGLFSRRSGVGQLTKIDIVAEDGISDIAHRITRTARFFENKKLSDRDESNSLLHLITRLATQRKVYNFAANSSFENATITNSWGKTGGCTFSKDTTTSLYGGACAKLVYNTASGSFHQDITFLKSKRLGVGETWTFYLWLKSASSPASQIRLQEKDASGVNDESTFPLGLPGGASWCLRSVSHTITDPDSDRLRIIVQLDGTGTIYGDGVMLIQNNRPYNWFVLNSTDGVAGVVSADDAVAAAYDTVGFDVDFVDITHPWIVINRHKNIWKYLKQLAIACGATYFGMDASGVLKMRAMLRTGYEDPPLRETIDDMSVREISTQMVPLVNKIEAYGIKIIKDTDLTQVWDAASTRLWGDGGPIFIQLLNGEQFPDPNLYPEFWAKISDDDQGDWDLWGHVNEMDDYGPGGPTY